MTDSDELYTGMKVGDDLSNAIGTEILVDRDLIRPSFDNTVFNILAIPVMSSECESLFSSAKKLLTLERNTLADDITDATECLKT